MKWLDRLLGTDRAAHVQRAADMAQAVDAAREEASVAVAEYWRARQVSDAADNDALPPPFDVEGTKLITRIVLLAVAVVPALYWLRLYWRHSSTR